MVSSHEHLISARLTYRIEVERAGEIGPLVVSRSAIHECRPTFLTSERASGERLCEQTCRELRDFEVASAMTVMAGDHDSLRADAGFISGSLQ